MAARALATCNGCGDCCERIGLSKTVLGSIPNWSEWYQGWRDWAWCHLLDGEDGGLTNDEQEYIANAEFITQHWRVSGLSSNDGYLYLSCDAFDGETRRCTVHDSKPPVCRNFPWYGDEPIAERLDGYPRCSYWHDVPFDKRPGAKLPVLQRC